MLVWSIPELNEHREVLLPNVPELLVPWAHSVLGGNLRWLRGLDDELHPGLAENEIRPSAENCAKRMLQRYLENASAEKLVATCRKIPQWQDLDDTGTNLSSLLQIDASAATSFQEPSVTLLSSEVASQTMKDQLLVRSSTSYPAFITSAIGIKTLGQFVGVIYQDHLLEQFTSKGSKEKKLEATGLKSGSPPRSLIVPNNRAEIQVASAKPQKAELCAPFLYAPLSDTFPAADFFFLTSEGELVLLQATRDTSHTCKIGRMYERMKASFTNLAVIKAICWVVVTPTDAIATAYKEEQDVIGCWESLQVQQYVATYLG
mmetsp:Transcript_16342/g.29728  ORF Transcript_16342/g.29728 Transcript_16342/m.29728 type:complete len:318 (-) Transcript_16342:58-1011(-)